MYDLGEHFKTTLENKLPDTSCVFKGNKYRITVLTERLVRLEYSNNGVFTDNLTQLVTNRNFKKPLFKVEESNSLLKITTNYFVLEYVKEKNFKGTKLSPMSNLKISLVNSDKIWYYGHPEVRNFNLSAYKLKNDKDRLIQRSLYSLDGFASIDDSKSAIINVDGTLQERPSNNIDIYVFLYNNDFYRCLTDYFDLTGYPPLIPRDALGNWWCKKEEYNDEEIAHLVKKFKDEDVPISLLVLNNWNKENEFIFKDKYKNIKDIIEFLHIKNIKLGLSIDDPIVFKNNTNINLNLKNYLPVDKDGNIPFNVYDPRTIDAFLKLVIHPIDNIGIDFYSINTIDKNHLDRLAIIKHYLYNDRLRLQNIRPIISAHNPTIAAHRYPVLYAGEALVDWNSLKHIPEFNLSASNMGISFYSHDFGGSKGGIEDSELFIRYIQLGVFSPILRIGSESGKYYKREPWKWTLKPRTIVKNFLNLRYRLIPYIYTEAYKYHKYGKPIIEPIYYRYPSLYDDANYNSNYYFGSNFYVSPIVTKKDYIMNRVIHKLFIPEGIWYDFFNGKKYSGNKKYVSFYRDHEYPVFVKAGSIIPMSLNEFNDTKVPSSMELQVFPGASNTYSIYEDDGNTFNYKNGDYLITNLEFLYKKNNYSLTILPVSGKKSIVPSTRNYKIVFKDTKPDAKVTSYVGSNKVDNKSYKDGDDLVVELENISTSAQLTVVCSGENIEIDAIRIINEDIVSIISDLPIKTVVKQRIDSIMFSDKLTTAKKRIEIRKLAHGKDYLERKYIDLFLKLLEYISEV